MTELNTLIERWRHYAAGQYCQTYNRGMATGLRQAADDLEAVAEADVDARRLGAMAIRHLLTGDCSEVLAVDPAELERAAEALEGVGCERKEPGKIIQLCQVCCVQCHSTKVVRGSTEEATNSFLATGWRVPNDDWHCPECVRAMANWKKGKP